MRKRKLQLDREILNSNIGVVDVDGATTQPCINTFPVSQCLPCGTVIASCAPPCPEDTI